MTLENVRTTIKEKIEGTLQSQIHYEWNGGDFTEEVSNLSGVNLKQINGGITFDHELHEQYVNHLTDYLLSKFDVEK